MNKLFLHIGTHKTGTSYIQKILNSKKNELSKENIIYLQQFPESFNLMCINHIDEKIIGECKKYLSTLIEPSFKNSSYVMSFEGFSGDLLQGYKNASIIAETLKQILEDFDVYIIVYLRRQDTFYESAYTQLIQQGESYCFEDFIKRYDSSSFNWYLLLSSYADYFGKNKLIVKIYDKENITSSNLIKSFAEIIESKTLMNSDSEEKSNIGYDRASLEMARICNPYLDKNGRRLMRNILQSSGARVPFQQYNYLTTSKRKSLLDQYKNSNELVRCNYFGGGTENLFSENICQSIDYEGLSLEDVARIMMLSFVNVIKNIRDQDVAMNEPKTFRVIRSMENYAKNNKLIICLYKWWLARKK